MRFQRTYKELKHSSTRFLAGDLNGFQRTYKELKLAISQNILIISVSFQRTYKELKPNKDYEKIFEKAIVSSVPIRN